MKFKVGQLKAPGRPNPAPGSTQVAEFQRQQQARDRASEADAVRSREPVDVQLGDQVYEDVPQELRARLYCVLTTRDDLAAALRVSPVRQVQVGTLLQMLRNPARELRVRLQAEPSHGALTPLRRRSFWRSWARAALGSACR
jgi:hypothetical protein